MRDVVSYQVETLSEGVLHLLRCDRGEVEETVVDNWLDAVNWLVQPPAGSTDVFTVCLSLQDFTKALFSLLPKQEREQIEGEADRIWCDDVKVFYVNGRYLGITADVPASPASNIVTRQELNLQALKWWISEDDEEPADVKALWRLGTQIVKTLARLEFFPTKLTSPVSVFQDCFLGDARKLPTIFNFPEDKFEAMEYATEMMRYEWRSAYQLGTFAETHLYDLVSAYPAIIARLPNTTDCRCEYAKERPAWAQWGVMHGEIEVTADVSPIVYEDVDGSRFNPKGKWLGTFTTSEVNWLEKWKAGSFKPLDGWFFRFREGRPYRDAVRWLYPRKNQKADKMLATIAKKMSQGLSGKLDEDRKDRKKGDLYNPVLACMVRSQTRIAVAEFIYQHQLTGDLITVLLDSVLATHAVELPPAVGMGSWRYEGALPAVVLSKGNIWRPGKRPQGISYDDLVAALVEKPESAYYEFKTASGSERSIDLLVDSHDLDRQFDRLPECGLDVLSNVYHSRAIDLE